MHLKNEFVQFSKFSYLSLFEIFKLNKDKSFVYTHFKSNINWRTNLSKHLSSYRSWRGNSKSLRRFCHVPNVFFLREKLRSRKFSCKDCICIRRKDCPLLNMLWALFSKWKFYIFIYEYLLFGYSCLFGLEFLLLSNKCS